MSPSVYCPRPVEAAYVSIILLCEVEQEQRPSGTRDREAIVVGAALWDGVSEPAYTTFLSHYDNSRIRDRRFEF